MSQVYDIDTVGYDANQLGGYYDFYVNDTFYMLAPPYYYVLYSNYFRRCLTAYDGWYQGYHNLKSGLVPQKMLQSVATGLNNLVFAKGIDFSGSKVDYEFAKKWAKKSKFGNVLKKAHKFAIAGGTSLLTLNRKENLLFARTYRLDNFYPEIDANGDIIGVKIFFEAITDTADESSTMSYGICERRYFNEEGKACIKSEVYAISGGEQSKVMARQNATPISYDELPQSVKKYILENYPDIIFDNEQYLPFYKSLGCYLIKFTDDIPQIPNTPFGQPIGDILFTENFQYDQMKYFEKNEVDLARARALVPEQFWNLDDPDADNRTLNERFYQKVSSTNEDNDKITPIQFLLRGNDIKTQKENIYRDIAFKLNISASSVATFLNEGAGARTATEILRESTKTDTWVNSQILLNSDSINNLLKDVMLYYGYNEVEIIIRAEDESPYLDKLKTNSDVYSAGNMSPERFVADTYKNLSIAEQKNEIAYLKKMAKQKQPTNQYGATFESKE